MTSKTYSVYADLDNNNSVCRFNFSVEVLEALYEESQRSLTAEVTKALQAAIAALKENL